MLMKLGYAYGSKDALHITDYIFSTMFREAVITSALLAKEKGSYPNYKPCVYDSTIIKNHFSNEEIAELRECGLRNCSLLSIAPNGSLATLLGESGGCEPEFAISYTRRTVGMTDGEDTYYQVYCKAAREYLDKTGEKELPSYFISSAEIDPHNRVLTQACMQNHVDTAISSTVNLPNSATKEDIAKIYLDAWKNGLKGITIFRDGCKRLGILTTSNSNTEHILERGDWKPKANDTVYYQKKLSIGCGKINLFIGWSESEQQIQDFYVKRVGTGGCERLLESTTISMSAILRLGGSIENIEKAFEGIGTCNSFAIQRGKGKKLSKGNSCGEVILNALKDFLKEHNIELTKKEENLGKCPNCGENTLVFEVGCQVCKSCGWSKCD